MNTSSIPGSLLSIPLMTFALSAFPVWGQEAPEAAVDTVPVAGEPVSAEPVVVEPGAAEPAAAEPANAAPEQPANAAGQERAYQHAIADLESREGAYAGGLSESVLSLALTLQSQGRHEEAAKLFRRGVHLARINEGLYCPQQIPLLQGEIASDIAMQKYALADERQNYLYRVQMRSMASGDSRTDALMQQAKWQQNAYQLGLEQQGYTRLMNMWDMYQQALQDVIAQEGETSPKCLPPLQGMLQAQYLISGYVIRDSDQALDQDGRIDESLMRFNSYRADSYQLGNSVIKSISDIELAGAGKDQNTLARTLVMLGDWRLWNGRTEAAWEAYRKAETELAHTDDAQTQTRQLFGEPVALPDIAGLNLLPPVVDPEQANILLAFGVSEQGRVQDLERMDENAAEDTQATQLMRQLRRTIFRPRFEAGQPVETERLVKAFHTE